MDFVKILGSSGSKSKNFAPSSFLISKDIVIDAGNILNALEEESYKINHIFLTHVHLDHIIDIPFMLDNCFSKREETLKVYGSKQSIKFLKENIFNNTIWPDFTKIKLLNRDIYSLELIEIDDKKDTIFEDLTIKAIETKHSDGSFAYLISKNEIKYLISGDTGFDEDLISYINSIEDLSALFIECSFPNSLDEVAKSSKHLTTNRLNDFLNKLKKRTLAIFLYHLKSPYQDRIKSELEKLNILKNGAKILKDGDIVSLKDFKLSSYKQDIDIFDRIMEINLKLSSEQDKEQLYEMVLTLLRELTLSDAGTLYLLSEDKKYLEFKVVQNETLNIFLGTKEEKISWNALPLYLENGEQNRAMVAVVCALDKKIINIKDVYNCDLYNFEGTKIFDRSKNYLSKSMLVIPLVNHEDDIIGVIQLINKDITNSSSFYNSYDEKIIKALSLQAAMALTNTILIDSLENFLESFVNSIANAIDAKSRHTSTHIRKMAKLAPMIANSINEDETIYKDIKYSKNDIKEIELAAKLHDIGKISIPEWVIDKSSKLQKLLDGLELISLRVEVLKRELKIDFLEKKIDKEVYEYSLKNLNDSLEFLQKANIGSEFMSDEDIKRLEEISNYKYFENGVEKNLLNKDEVYNLSIRKGTLTSEERDIMNSHAELSYNMLSALPFPKKYSNIMHIAVNHHEKLNGKGYPRGLGENDLVLEDRILILADIFEALTSNDRPYKGIKKLSEVFKIFNFMIKDGEIDKDLFEFFKSSKAFKEYCETELLIEQIDV